MPLIVKFICHLYDSEVSWSVVLTVILAISKYHVVDKNTGTPIGQHPLVTTARKLFGLTLPRYYLVSHLTELTFPNFKYSLLSLTVLLRASSLSVLGIVVHEGVDGAVNFCPFRHLWIGVEAVQSSILFSLHTSLSKYTPS